MKIEDIRGYSVKVTLNKTYKFTDFLYHEEIANAKSINELYDLMQRVIYEELYCNEDIAFELIND